MSYIYGGFMQETEQSIDIYLQKFFICIKESSRFTICLDRKTREKNSVFVSEFGLKDADLKKLLLSLIPKDFSEVVQNSNPIFAHEMLYVFKKETTLTDINGEDRELELYIKINLITTSSNDEAYVISCHPAEKPMSYYFDR